MSCPPSKTRTDRSPRRADVRGQASRSVTGFSTSSSPALPGGEGVRGGTAAVSRGAVPAGPSRIDRSTVAIESTSVTRGRQPPVLAVSGQPEARPAGIVGLWSWSCGGSCLWHPAPGQRLYSRRWESHPAGPSHGPAPGSGARAPLLPPARSARPPAPRHRSCHGVIPCRFVRPQRHRNEPGTPQPEPPPTPRTDHGHPPAAPEQISHPRAHVPGQGRTGVPAGNETR